MKKLNLVLMAVLISITAFTSLAQPKREFRAGWIAVMDHINWPSVSAVGTSESAIAAQKNELISILDAMAYARLNSAFFHARIQCDATYPSQYAAWSHYLTGTRGVAPDDPTWDPLKFFVEESHKRGMQAVAWLNPYRFCNEATLVKYADFNTSYDQEMKQHVIVNSKNYYTLDPAQEWSLTHIKNVVREIVENYDVDGIVFDDYFYPNNIVETSEAGDYQEWKNSGTSLGIADWRRANVNKMVKEVNELIQSINPNVTFGISPAGIAGTQKTSGPKYPELKSYNPANGYDWQYNGIYSDPLAWLKAQTIDYISPQLYWGTNHSTNAFGTQTQWWSEAASVFGRHNYPSSALQGTSNTDFSVTDSGTYSEYLTEVNYTRNSTENAGSIMWSVAPITNTAAFKQYVRDNVFTRPALRPVMTWKAKAKANYIAPTGVALNGTTLSWNKVTSDRGAQYAVYAIPNSITLAMSKGSDGIKGDYLIGTPYNNEMDIPAEYRNGYWFAVTAVDAAGYEYEPTTLNEPDPSVIPDIIPTIPNIEEQSKWKQEWRNDSYIGNARNLCYGDGKVFVATTDGNIHVLNSKTGARITGLNMSGVSGGGTFDVCGVQYRNGKIYAANLHSVTSGNVTIKVYCWNSIGAAPTTVLNTTTSEITRAGDHFGMTDNYFYFVNGNKALRYRIGTTTMEKTTLPITLGSSPHIDPVDDNSFWVTSINNNPIRYNWVTGGNATQAESTSNILGNPRGVGFAPFTMSNGAQYAFLVDYLTADLFKNGCANLIRKQNGSWNTGANVHLPQGGLSSTDNNTTSSSIAVNLSDANGVTTAVDMWILVTNQGLAHYTIGAEDAYINDAAGRFYRVPGSGPYAGRKLMELTVPETVGTFRLTCKTDNEYGLDVNGDSQDNNTNVQIYKTGQTFEITNRSDGYCTISRNGKCVTIENDPKTVSNGNNIIMYEYNGGANMLWKFVRNDDGSYTIVSKKDKNFVLDVNGGTMANKTNVQLYTSNNSDAQKWILEPVGNAALPGYAVPDSYFQRYLIDKGYARIYNENSHEITGNATLSANFDTYAKAGSGEHVVILPETIAALTEFNGMGEYGDEGSITTAGKDYTQFKGVDDLKGIEYFTELKKLDMCRAKFGLNPGRYGGLYTLAEDGEIKLKYNTKLEYIDLDFNAITDFDKTGITGLKNLKYLNISNNNKVKSIDLSQLESLEQFSAEHCFELTRIDAAENENLKVLDIHDTMYGYESNYSLQKLVDNYPNLAFLHAFATFNSDLDLSKHTQLMSLWLHNSVVGVRQKAKGNWLHKLDLSGCTELRDVHVQNMHLAALNIPSTHLGEDFPDEYKNLKVSPDICIGSDKTPHGGTPPHDVDVTNNYRHISPNLFKWQDAATKQYYYIYYLRLGGVDRDPTLAGKKGWYVIKSYDMGKYVNDNSRNDESTMSEKIIQLENDLATDLFDADKVDLSGWKTATVENTISTTGVMTHKEGNTYLCTINNHEAIHPDGIDAAVIEAVKKKISGSAVILKAGIGETPNADGAPLSICYSYNMLDTDARDTYPGVFYFDLDYSAQGIVTDIDCIDADKQVASVKYYNLMGVEFEPQTGDIVVARTQYTDGTVTYKVIKK